MGRGDGDLLVEAEVDEGGVDVLHHRDEALEKDCVVGGEHLVANRYGGDLGVGKERLDFVLDPGPGLVRVPHPGQVLVPEPHRELDPRLGEGA